MTKSSGSRHWPYSLAAAVLTALVSNFAQAGGSGGVIVSGSGDGLMGSRLFRKPVEISELTGPASFVSQMKRPKGYGIPLLKINGTFDVDLVRLLTIEINKIYDRDPHLASVIVDSLGSYQWVFTMQDLAFSTLDPLREQPGAKRIQFTLQRDQVVYIQSGYWAMMDNRTRVGLILHTVVSILAQADVTSAILQPY